MRAVGVDRPRAVRGQRQGEIRVCLASARRRTPRGGSSRGAARSSASRSAVSRTRGRAPLASRSGRASSPLAPSPTAEQATARGPAASRSRLGGRASAGRRRLVGSRSGSARRAGPRSGPRGPRREHVDPAGLAREGGESRCRRRGRSPRGGRRARRRRSARAVTSTTQRSSTLRAEQRKPGGCNGQVLRGDEEGDVRAELPLALPQPIRHVVLPPVLVALLAVGPAVGRLGDLLLESPAPRGACRDSPAARPPARPASPPSRRIAPASTRAGPACPGGGRSTPQIWTLPRRPRSTGSGESSTTALTSTGLKKRRAR